MMELWMQEQSTFRVVQNFIRKVLLTDLILAILMGFISYFLEIRTLEGYGTLLTWAGAAVMGFACLVAIGGFASRTQDYGAFTVSGAGNMFEHLEHISDARQSSLGCFALFMSIGLGLVAIGDLLQIVGGFAF
jgi:hypothetical protein